MLMNVHRLIPFLILTWFYCSNTIASETILINHPLSKNDHRYDYPKALLEKILAATPDDNEGYEISTNGISMSRTRALNSLIEGKHLHVMAEAPKPEWNTNLLSVRIPIRKGIQGFRLFLTRQVHKGQLAQISTLEQFKALTTGSGEQWSTTKVLEHAGFNVIKGVDYEGLFGMLIRDRFVTFGRGINEVFDEYEQRKSTLNDLAIDDRFLLYIPLPTYFFVTPTKPWLRDRIEEGLNILIENGEFDQFFIKEFGALIERAKLDKRIKFSIPNPNLTDDDPLNVEKYWYFNSP